MIIHSRERDLGDGLIVQRILPHATHRMVGPFIFFDHMGPASFAPGGGMDVRPHPHINLATVTYLFKGRILHRDSLGSSQLIEPGAVNWMTAGRGIVHSERTPPDARASGTELDGIQCWVALPEEHEEIEPSFAHHPKDTLPEFAIDGARLKLLLGDAFGRTSPVRVHSDLFYLEVFLPAGQRLALPHEGREAALYVVTGRARLGSDEIGARDMGVAMPGSPAVFEAVDDTHAMLLGGSPVGQRFIYWNFVSSSAERLESVKREWAEGPGSRPSGRFPRIPGDDAEFIPLPVESGRGSKQEPKRDPEGTPL